MYRGRMNLKFSPLHKWRRISQVGFGFLFINSYIPVLWEKVLYSGALRQFCVPVLNCHSCPTALFACPIGMIQYSMAMQAFPFFVLGFLGLVGLIGGRFACGWLCPFGLVQDLMFKIRSVKFRLPQFTSYFKYVFLIVLVFILPYITGTNWFSRLCPWGGIIAAIPWVAWNPEIPGAGISTIPEEAVGMWFVIKVVLVVAFMGLFVFVKRPFCFAVCPLGAIFSFFNKISFLKIEVNENCNECDQCKAKCALNMVAFENANNLNCVECLECTACQNVKVKFNLDNARLPETHPGAPCQNACPIKTEAWRYIAHIERNELDEAYKAIRETNPFPSVCSRVCHHPCEEVCKTKEFGYDPVAIRELKKYVTDNTDPAVFTPMKLVKGNEVQDTVAVIGAGPAGLTAAHELSMKGYRIRLIEADQKPGGMLVSAIPEYRLPRDILIKEIDSFVNDNNITLELNTSLGKDVTIDELLNEGCKAVFVALGSHKSQNLGLKNEKSVGIYPALEYLKDFNLTGKSKIEGKIGIIGGGNSAIDSARVAIRQEHVEKVTVFYRRTREEMPAYSEEVEAAIEEGIRIETLVSPVEIKSDNGKLTGVTFIRNELGEPDESGRRRPVPVHKSEITVELDSLLVSIGEYPDTKPVDDSDIEFGRRGEIIIDDKTMQTSIPGVFAGGDFITGPNTVVDAIAAGKKAAKMIDRYIRGEDLEQLERSNLPKVFVEPLDFAEKSPADRIRTESLPAESRKLNFQEVDKTFSSESAKIEAGRCLRCDMKYTKPLEFRKIENTYKSSS